MEKNKLNLILFVADKLSAAPEGAAKADLVEELSDNLYQRYADLVAAGVPEEDALQKAKDGLGDVEELIDYLNGLEPDQPLPGEKSAASQLDDVLRDVEAICKAAMGRAKSAIREAKETMEESGIGSWSWKSEDGQVEISVSDGETCPGDGEKPAEPAGEEPAGAAGDQGGGPVTGNGRDISGEVSKAVQEALKAARAAVQSDAVQGAIRTTKGVVKDAVHTVKDAVSSLGARGKGGNAGHTEGEPGGPEKAADSPDREGEDGETTIRIEADDSQTLRGIDVQTGAGDVTIRANQPADGDVLVGGDIGDLEVTRREDGVLVIRQGRTASASFLFGRGVGSADVELDLPLRDWSLLNVDTGNGNVELELEGVGVDDLIVRTGAGDVRGELPFANTLNVKSASGDIDWHGNTGILQCQSASGDVNFYGVADAANVRSVSGDVCLEGSFPMAQCGSVSGDVRLATQVLPDRLEVSSTSGDCEVRIPDGGGFVVSFKTTSGNFASDFFDGGRSGRSGTLTYQEGGPIYNLKSMSGDLRLKKY